MKLTFLGTGTSTGVPQIGCRCAVCRSADSRDSRLRTSVMVAYKGKRILLDCGPDFRAQSMQLPFESIDAVLLSHEHFDHVGGIDDLRPFCTFGEVNIYSEENVLNALYTRMPYCFKEQRYPGAPKIALIPIDINTPFQVEDIEIIPIRVMHGRLPIAGYRIGDMAYLTDMSTIPDTEYAKLKGVTTLIISGLRKMEHPTHQNVEEAIAQIARIGAKESYLIHMSHDFGLHAESEAELPNHIHVAYDGLTVEW